MPSSQNVDAYLSRITDALHSSNFNEADFLQTVRGVLDDYSTNHTSNASTVSHTSAAPAANNSADENDGQMSSFQYMADDNSDNSEHSTVQNQYTGQPAQHVQTSTADHLQAVDHPQPVANSGDNSGGSSGGTPSFYVDHQQGTLVDQDGVPVHGLTARIAAPDDPGSTQNALNPDFYYEAANLGANIIRLDVTASVDGQTIEEQLPRIDEAINLAKAAGLGVQLEFSQQSVTMDPAETAAFWEIAAPKYANDRDITFELTNEPAWPPYDNGTVSAIGDIYHIMRNAAPDKPIGVLDYPTVTDAGNVLDDVHQLESAGVNFNDQTTIAFHGYGTDFDQVQQVRDAGYSMQMTEITDSEAAGVLQQSHNMGIASFDLAGGFGMDNPDPQNDPNGAYLETFRNDTLPALQQAGVDWAGGERVSAPTQSAAQHTATVQHTTATDSGSEDGGHDDQQQDDQQTEEEGTMAVTDKSYTGDSAETSTSSPTPSPTVQHTSTAANANGSHVTVTAGDETREADGQDVDLTVAGHDANDDGASIVSTVTSHQDTPGTSTVHLNTSDTSNSTAQHTVASSSNQAATTGHVAEDGQSSANSHVASAQSGGGGSGSGGGEHCGTGHHYDGSSESSNHTTTSAGHETTTATTGHAPTTAGETVTGQQVNLSAGGDFSTGSDAPGSVTSGSDTGTHTANTIAVGELHPSAPGSVTSGSTGSTDATGATGDLAQTHLTTISAEGGGGVVTGDHWAAWDTAGGETAASLAQTVASGAISGPGSSTTSGSDQDATTLHTTNNSGADATDATAGSDATDTQTAAHTLQPRSPFASPAHDDIVSQPPGSHTHVGAFQPETGGPALDTAHAVHTTFDGGDTGQMDNTWGQVEKGDGYVSVTSPGDTHDAAGIMVTPSGAEAGTGYGRYDFTLSTANDHVGPYAALWPSTDQWPGPEIDVFELGQDTGAYSTIHWNDNGNDGYNYEQMPGNPDPTQPHTYSVDWSDGQMTFSLDGQPYRTETENIPKDFAHGGENLSAGIGELTSNFDPSMNPDDNTLTMHDFQYTPHADMSPVA